MEIKDLIKKQSNFDESHESLKHWNEKITENNLDVLNYLLLAAAGEIGEASNVAKKIIRGDFTLNDKIDSLSEELIDAFIYIIKLINQLGIDLEKEYDKKMQYNAKRFGSKDGKR